MITSPPLCLPLPTPDEMSRWDQAAHSLYGISPLLLMENAAQAAVAQLRSSCALSPSRRVLIFMGKGNNGGDGAAMARILHDEGCRVLLCSTAAPEDLPSPAKEHAAMALALGVPFRILDSDGDDALFTDAALERDLSPEMAPDVVIDALTGTGIKGELRPNLLSLVRRINAYRDRAFILSLDIPSGLSGLTGRPMPEAVRAHATVCFEEGKPGLFIPGAEGYTGELFIRRVGIPLELRKRFPPSWQLLQPQKGAWARPSPFTHKGRAGRVLIIGGSEGLAGAPVLAALGGLRAGAGLMHVALPAELEPAVRAAWPEILTHPVGEGSHWREADAASLERLIKTIGPDALVIGPGMGRTASVGVLLAKLMAIRERPPVILDADALFFLRLPENEADADAPAAALLRSLTARDILTPHPGEMARLLPDAFFQKDEQASMPGRIRRVQENRPEALERFTRVCPAVLVLKGAGSLIGCSGRATALSPFAVATLGVGGSGDVLSGICASLAASGMESFAAACLGVYLHGRAGEILAGKAGRGHLVREIAEAVPQAWEELC